MQKDGLKYNFAGTGLTPDEKEWGISRFDSYRISYPHLNKLGNLQLLEELVWAEAIQERHKKQIGKLAAAETQKGKDIYQAHDPKVMKNLTDGLAQIVEMKTKLGMLEDQKMQEGFQYIQELFDKFEQYRQDNPASFKCTCPFCAKCFALMRRTDCYEEFKSPFLEDKILNNKPLMDLYHDQILNKEQVAKILGVSSKYIEWLDAKCYGIKMAEDEILPEQPPLDESAPSHQ